jgi:hypothetical protein
MENQPNQSPKPVNKSVWIVLVIVILVIAGYGIYALIVKDTDNTNNTNIPSNTNHAANTNASVNTNSSTNTNSAANSNATTNAVANSNTNSATNTNIDTSGWKTYEDEKFGFTFKYPDGWKLSEYENGTISVAPGISQEKIPLLKALSGSTADTYNWVVENWLDPEAGTLVRTSEQYAFGDIDGQIYQIDGQDAVIIAELGDFSIAVNMNVIKDELPFTDYGMSTKQFSDRYKFS